MTSLLAPLASFALRAVLPFLVLFAAYALGYLSGKSTEHTHSLAALAAQSAQHESQRLRDTAAALSAQAALTQHADQLSSQLADKSTQRRLRTRTLSQEISHAVLSPRPPSLSPCPADLLCLDDHELQLYRSALGYPDPADLPAPTGQSDPIAPHAPATGSGLRLSPADLLYHAADYGEWCAQRDDQARTLAALYAPALPVTPAEQSHD